MVNSFSIIDEKLKRFSRKYYLNRILKGSIFWFILVLLFSFCIFIFEYFFYFSNTNKVIILITSSIFIFSAFIYLIILPFVKYLGFFKKLSKEQISSIIVKHFPEIKDKLLNIIELNDECDSTIYSKELIVSSIDQKISDIGNYRFRDSINLNKNISLLKYFILGLIISVMVGFIFPDFYKDSSYRLINYKKSFEKPSPFQFQILNEKLSVGKGEDFVVRVFVKSKRVAEYLNISLAGKDFLMKKDSTSFYSYKFNNLNNDIYFQFVYDKFKSKFYQLNILEKPLLNGFSVHLVKPSYIFSKDEYFDNVTEFLVPEGTKIEYRFNSVFTDSLFIKNNDLKNVSIESSNHKIFNYSDIYKLNTQLAISLKNESFTLENYLKLNVSIVKDEYPTISVAKIQDSFDFTKVYFKGKIGDDYGFSKLNFILKSNEKVDTIIDLNFLKNIQNQQFYYAFDFKEFKKIYKNIDYFFEVADNDQVNGPKKAISEIFSFVFPDESEILENQKNSFDSIDNIISNSKNLAELLKKDLNDVDKKLINSDLTDWERNEIQKNISSKKENISKEVEKLREKNDEINNYLKSFTDQDQKIIEKQKQIQDLLENIFSDDLKKLLDEFNKMMQEYNKDKLNSLKDKLDISLEDLSKQLDKNLELLKRMQIEQQLDLFSQSFTKTTKEQEDLLKDIEKEFDKNDLSKKEEILKEDFSKAEKLYHQIEDQNKLIKQPLNLYDFSQEFNEIKQELANSSDNLGKGNKKKSKESFSKNDQNLKNIDFKIKQMLDSLFKEKNSENLEDLMQILDNLIVYSFNQEELINSTNSTNFNSIIFSKQKKLFSDYDIIKDSLYALSRREPSLDSKVNKELVQTQYYFKDIENDFKENEISNVLIDQQKVLTSVNDLSLFLSEIIKQLQKSMANSMPGNQNCKKPGNNPNPNSMSSSLKSMQKSLQQQLEKAMQMMKEGSSGKAVNNELGKAISQQEAMHDLLQKMMNQGHVGSNAYETLKQADQLLDKVKDDILRNDLSSSTIERQKQILTRLLEADKAENERDIDEKRKSNTADKQFFSKTGKQFENDKTINNFEEKLLKNKLILNSYYQIKYQKYTNVLDSINGEIYKNNFIYK